MSAPTSHPPPSHHFLERYLLLRPAGLDAAGRPRLEVRYSRVPESSPEDAIDSVTVSSAAQARVRQTMLLLEQAMSLADDRVVPQQVQKMGIDLAEIALPSRIETPLQADLKEAAGSGRRVRLWVDDRCPVVSGWPWEYLFRAGGYLALDQACSLVRSCRRPARSASPEEARWPAGPDLEALIVWADPQAGPWCPLHAEVQVRAVQKSFTGPGRCCRLLWPAWSLRNPKLWPFVDDPAQVATRANLERELQERPPHLVYVVSHGDFDNELKQGFVVLEHPGEAGFEGVRAEELAKLFPARGGPRVVFLEGCRSGSRGPTGDGLSVTDVLAAAGRIVVGMQSLWPALASFRFWTSLFDTLTAGRVESVDVALSNAREVLIPFRTHYWGIPVLYRPQPHLLGIPPLGPPRPSQADQHLRALARSTGLEGLERHVGLRDALIRALEDLQDRPERGSEEVEDALAEHDPYYRLVAGESDLAPVETFPLWFTHLLEPPAELSWQCDDRPGPWRVRLWGGAGDVFAGETAEPAIALPVGRVPRGVDLAWEVCPVSAGAEALPLVQGLFRVLPVAESIAAGLHLGELAMMPDGLGRVLALADRYARDRLYDSLVRFLGEVAAAQPDDLLRYALRRALAGVYTAVSRELGKRYPRGIPEVEWAAQLGREQVSDSCRLLGLL